MCLIDLELRWIYKKKIGKVKVYHRFVDFRKVFDINLKYALFQIVKDFNFPNLIIFLVMILHETIMCKVKVGTIYIGYTHNTIGTNMVSHISYFFYLIHKCLEKLFIPNF